VCLAAQIRGDGLMSVRAGGLAVTDGALTVAAGGLVSSAGGVTVAAGGAVVDAGGITVTVGVQPLMPVCILRLPPPPSLPPATLPAPLIVALFPRGCGAAFRPAPHP
jgi:hypothetical protein